MSEFFLSTDDGTRQILLEHRSLLDALLQIESVVERLPREGRMSAAHGQSLARLLDEFVANLASHFEAEVQTSTFESCDPSMLRQLRELDAEHQSLLAAFERARHLARDEAVLMPKLRSLVLESITAFRDHEAKEDALFGESG